MQRFQGLGILDENAVLRTAAHSHHHGCRGCQTHGAGAGDDEHRDGVQHGQAQGVLLRREQIPRREGDRRGSDHGRGEIAADDIGQPRDGRLGALGFFDQLDDARQHRRAAHFTRSKEKTSRCVDGSAENEVPGRFVHRYALAGQRGFVDRGLAAHHFTVDRNAFAWPDHDHIPNPYVFDGDVDFDTRAHNASARCLQLQQTANGGRRSAARLRLQEPAEQDQGDDGRGRFEVDRNLAGSRCPRIDPAGGDGRNQRIKERRSCTYRDQGVHVSRPPPQALPCRNKELSSRIEHYRQRESQLHPVPAREYQRAVGHRDDEQGHRKRRRENELAFPDGGFAFLLFTLCFRDRRLCFASSVSGALDRLADGGHISMRGLVLNRGRACGQIDFGSSDTEDSSDSPLYRADATRACHAADLQFDGLRRAGRS